MKSYIAKEYFNVTEDDFYFPLDDDKIEYANLYNNYFKEWTKILIFNYPLETAKKTCTQLFNLFFNYKKNLINFNKEINITNAPKEDIGYFKYQEFSEILIVNNPDAHYSVFTINTSRLNKPNVVYDFLTKKHNYVPNQKIKLKYPKITEFLKFDIFVRLLLFIILISVIIMLFRKKLTVFLLSIFILITSAIITIAVLHTFDIDRYFYSLLPLILSFLLFGIIDFFQKRTENNNLRETMNKVY